MVNKCLRLNKIAGYIIFCVFITTLPLFTKAEIRQGYDLYDNNNQSLQYNTLENSESLQKFEDCYSQDQIHRYPEIESSQNRQSICYDKYSTVKEYQDRLNIINKVLQDLSLVEKSSETSLANTKAVFDKFKNTNSISNETLQFFIVPKGAIIKATLDKTINHKPLCKVDNIVGTKVIVQSCEIKKLNTNYFNINNPEQRQRVFKNIADIEDFINKNGGQKLGIIDIIRLAAKASSLADDLLLLDSQSYLEFKQSFGNDEISQNTAMITLQITDSPNKDSKNPSNKTIKINLVYPQIDKDLNFVSFANKDLPPAYLETFNNNVRDRLIDKMQNRVKEYTKLQKEFEKSKATQEEGINTIKKDTTCFDTTKQQAVTTKRPDEPLEKLSFTEVIKDATVRTWQTVVNGAKFSYDSVFNKTVEVVSFTPSPTPETPLSKYLKSAEKPADDQIGSGSNTTNSQVSIPINSNNSNSSSGSPNTSPSPSTRPSSNPRTTTSTTPSPSPTRSPSPSASPSRTPSPSPSISISPSPSTTASPSPTPSTSPSISPSATPTPSPSQQPQTPTPTPSTNPKPTPSPQVQAFLIPNTVSKMNASVINSIINISNLFIFKNK